MVLHFGLKFSRGIPAERLLQFWKCAGLVLSRVEHGFAVLENFCIWEVPNHQPKSITTKVEPRNEMTEYPATSHKTSQPSQPETSPVKSKPRTAAQIGSRVGRSVAVWQLPSSLLHAVRLPQVGISCHFQPISGTKQAQKQGKQPIFISDSFGMLPYLAVIRSIPNLSNSPQEQGQAGAAPPPAAQQFVRQLPC
jgi:hypothetical protein